MKNQEKGKRVRNNNHLKKFINISSRFRIGFTGYRLSGLFRISGILYFFLIVDIHYSVAQQITSEDFELAWKEDSAQLDLASLYERIRTDIYFLPDSQRMSFFQRTINLFEDPKFYNDSLRATAEVLLAIDLATGDDYRESLFHYQEGLKYYRRIFPDSNYYVHSTYFHIAEKNFLMGDVLNAKVYCDSAILCQWPYQKGKNWARTTNLLARIYGRLGDQGRAEKLLKITEPYRRTYVFEDESYYIKSTGKIYEDLVQPNKILENCLPFYRNSPQIESIASLIGIAYFDLEEYDSAITIFRKIINNTTAPEEWMYTNLAHTYSHTGKAQEALNILLQIDTQNWIPKDLFRYQVNLAQTYRDAGDLHRAIDIDKSIQMIPSKVEIDPLVEIRFYTNWSDHVLQALQIKPESTEVQKYASLFFEIHERINKLRVNLHSASGRQNFSRLCRRFYDNVIRIHNFSFEQSPSGQTLNDILQLMEATKALIVAEEFVEKRNKEISKLLYREKYQSFEEALNQESDDAAKIEYCDSIFYWLLKENQTYENDSFLKLSKNLTTPANQAVYEYFVHLDTSLTIIKIESGTYQMKHQSRTDWYRLVIDLLDDIDKDKYKQFDLVRAQELYAILFPDELSTKRDDVLIIPDGILLYFPFDILVDRHQQFLIRLKNLNYCFSLALMNEVVSFSNENDSTFIFAPSFSENTDNPTYWRQIRQLGALTHNRREAEEIEHLLPQSRVFIGNDASKEHFISIISSASIVHLATHALASQDGSYEPQILLAGTNEVASLRESELYQLRVTADMVVMSACQTAIGRYEPGEGVMSFARAFMAAGSKSVLASLWSVNDETTANIMISYYHYLRKGKRKDEALRLAKLDYLDKADPAYLNPYYWAGFITMGDSDSMVESKVLTIFLIMSASLVVSFLLYYLWKKPAFYKR